MGLTGLFYLNCSYSFSFYYADILTLSLESSTATSLTISWMVDDDWTATGYNISYSNTDTVCFTDSNTISSLSGDETMRIYTMSSLQEGTAYSITVLATLNGELHDFHTRAITNSTG